MKVKFKFYGAFREVTKTKDLEITTTETFRIFDVLNLLLERYGDKMRKILFDPTSNSLRGDFQLLINGRNIQGLEGVNTFLKDGDVVTIYPPVVGG